jgi:capsular polysaccharide biosynthesis protein
MSDQPLDLRRWAHIVWRHKTMVCIFAALSISAGVGWTLLRPPMLSSQALVDVGLPPSEQAEAPVQAGAASVDPALQTQIVIAGSTPVLESALRTIGQSMSLQTLRTRVQITSVASSDILSISAKAKTAAQAEDTANAIADSYVAVINSRNAPGGQTQAGVVEPATPATGPSLPSRLLIVGGLAALFGALAGAMAALAFDRRDPRLRKRDDIADSIGVPVLASIRAVHPSGAAGWSKLLADYKPGAVDAWRLRKALQYLGLADLNLDGSQPGGGSSVEVLSFGSDSGALALGPQLAVFAASQGIPTALAVGPQQDVAAAATLRTACAAPPAPSRPSSRLDVIVRDHDGGIRSSPDAAMTVVVAVVDGQSPRVADTTRTAATVLGVSAGAVTATQLARVAASAAAAGHVITGILLADPDPDDHTTGRLPQLARPAQRRGPTRMTGTTAETR